MTYPVRIPIYRTSLAFVRVAAVLNGSVETISPEIRFRSRGSRGARVRLVNEYEMIAYDAGKMTRGTHRRK